MNKEELIFTITGIVWGLSIGTNFPADKFNLEMNRLLKSEDSISTNSEEKVEAHTKVSMDAYDKGVKHGKKLSEQDRLMEEAYYAKDKQKGTEVSNG